MSEPIIETRRRIYHSPRPGRSHIVQLQARLVEARVEESSDP